ncbi:hypothetical protein D6C84_01540 [Aureobasidium pullulans]|uniref:Uncharacterized protein n=1 Tax=Aureobasidium pullulans TaxID=5580 RepID=A0A4S9Y4B8_AURPU|nr:hypothetical protein D6C84_01540 [Aureobasidium pullulans]
MHVYETKDGSLYSRTGVISPPPPPPPPPSPSSPDLLTNSFEPQICQTILTIISAVHTTNLAISTYRNLCTSNVHKITAIKHLSLTADAVAIASLRKKYAQLITAEMKMCSGFADAWVCDLEEGGEGYGSDSDDERYDGDSDETYDEDEEEDEDAAPFEDPITEPKKMLITLLGTDSPTPPPEEMLTSNSPPFDEHRASYNRWEQAFDRDLEDNISITEHEDLSIKIKWQYEQPEQKKSINIDNIYHWIGKCF